MDVFVKVQANDAAELDYALEAGYIESARQWVIEHPTPIKGEPVRVVRKHLYVQTVDGAEKYRKLLLRIENFVVIYLGEESQDLILDSWEWYEPYEAVVIPEFSTIRKTVQ